MILMETTSDTLEPSPWIRRWTPLVTPGTTVLDVACGRGRHMRWFAARGHPVVGVDRNSALIAQLQDVGEVVHADIETDAWPFAGRSFGAVVVTNYLWRPLLGTLARTVADSGILLYETFARGQDRIGRPRNPAFLLEPGELLRHFAPPLWHVLAFEDGFESNPYPRFVQRIVAIRRVAQESVVGACSRLLLPPG